MQTYKIKYQDQIISCKPDEALVDAFIRQGIEINFSCKKGSCQVCMMQCNGGDIPEASQINLKAEYIAEHFFLPCCCTPTSDMTVSTIPSNTIYHSGIIQQKECLSNDVCKLLIEPSNAFNYKPGQYINLRRMSDGIARSYSLVSHPDDYFIELHIKKMHNGELSSWIFNELKAGDEINYQGAMGNSHYGKIESTETPLVFIGRGTGIAPLYGITLDALKHKHTADISIYHEGNSQSDIYLHEQLISLSQQNKQLNYTACVNHSENQNLDDFTFPNSSFTLLESSITKLMSQSNKPIFFIAGSPDFIIKTKKILDEHNVSSNHVFSDSFDFKELRSTNQTLDTGRRESDPQYIETKHNHKTSKENKISQANQPSLKDREIWHALENGKKLKIILDDFYSQVYEDDKLSGFFRNSTQKRSSEKQYLFMRQLFTGEKVYFGDRPKNAHHWMVISDELFDYRETILCNCLREHGLDEHLIEHWISYDESFRQDIVKKQAFAKIVNGIEQPLNGYESLKIDEGTLCDGCQEAINKGETVRYHIRLGLTYCHACMESKK